MPLKAKADRASGFARRLLSMLPMLTSQFDINLRRRYTLAFALDLGLAVQAAGSLHRYNVFHFFADRGLLDQTVRLRIDSEVLARRGAGNQLYI